MVFWKRRTHKLPKFPPNVIPTFYQLCESVDASLCDEMKSIVETTFAALFKEAEEKSFIDCEVAKELQALCIYLLDIYPNYPPAKQKLIIGAVRYVAIADDPFDETVFASGFHDDKRILNFVLEELGIEGKFLEVNY